jgi:hypothetical protein
MYFFVAEIGNIIFQESKFMKSSIVHDPGTYPDFTVQIAALFSKKMRLLLNPTCSISFMALVKGCKLQNIF